MIHLAILRQFESNTLYIYHYFNIFGNSKQIFRVTSSTSTCLYIGIKWIATNTYRRQSSVVNSNVERTGRLLSLTITNQQISLTSDALKKSNENHVKHEFVCIGGRLDPGSVHPTFGMARQRCCFRWK